MVGRVQALFVYALEVDSLGGTPRAVGLVLLFLLTQARRVKEVV